MTYGFGCYLPPALFALVLLYLIWRIGNELEEIAHRFLRPQPVIPPAFGF